MKPKFYTLLLATIIIVFAGCKSATKLYKKGNYDEAVELAVKKLQKDPNDAKLQSVIQSAYRYAVEDHESRIRNHSNSSNELRWVWIYNEYNSLQRLHDAIRSAPQVYNLVRPADYSSYITTYREKAGDMHYERAMTWMDRGDKQGYRNAYREFQSALAYKPGDMEIRERMMEAYEEAVVHVVIMPMQQQYGYMYSSNDFRNIEDDLIRNLRYQTSNDFVKFYTRWEADQIEPDQVIDLAFNNLNIGRVHDNRSTRRVSKEVVIKEIVYKPDSIVKQYGTVHATITTTRRTMYSEGALSLNVRDARGRWLWSDHFRGDHRWETEFATYTGDERALSESDKQLINRREQYPPREDDILREIFREIDSEMGYRVRDYYNRL